MKAMKKAVLGVVGASAVGIGFAVSAVGSASGQSTTGAKLTAIEQAGLQFSREEERMARDLYRQFAARYGSTPFAAISQSEQRHFDAVGRLLVTYRVHDPSATAESGVYADSAVQKLYDGWKAKGLTSVTAAYQVGVALEKRDIADLNKLQRGTNSADLDRVYARLANASQHHLTAFTAAAEGKALPASGSPAGRPGGVGAGGMGPGHRSRTGSGARMGGGGHGPGMGGHAGDCPFD